MRSSWPPEPSGLGQGKDRISTLMFILDEKARFSGVKQAHGLGTDRRGSGAISVKVYAPGQAVVSSSAK